MLSVEVILTIFLLICQTQNIIADDSLCDLYLNNIHCQDVAARQDEIVNKKS